MVVIKKTPRMLSPFNRLGQPIRNTSVTSRSFAAMASLIIGVLLIISLTTQPLERNDEYLRRRVNAAVDEIQASTSAADFHADSADERDSVSVDNFRDVSADNKSDSWDEKNDSSERDHAVDDTVVDKLRANSSVDDSAAAVGEVQSTTSATSLQEEAAVSINTDGRETKESNTSSDGPSQAMSPISTGGKEGEPIHSTTQPGEESGVDQSVSSNDPRPKDSGSLDEAESATTKVSLREQLLARSLETKQLISKKLREVLAPSQNPQYRHHRPPRNPGTATSRSCEEEDAFAGVPIDGGAGNGAWAPPGGFPVESMQKWDREYRTAMSRIKAVTVGGSELREVARTEVLRLRELRHRLFCSRDM